MEWLIAGIVGFVAALVLVFVLRRGGGSSANVEVHASIEQMRSVGELVVFRLVTKEIVTSTDHGLGDIGRRYLSWLISEKKMAMIFEFGIDFKFDLNRSEFVIDDQGDGRYRLQMPDCMYTTSILDISFYDEQGSKLLPVLLPDLINQVFSGGFDEDDKNKLKEAAKEQANVLAEQMVERIASDVQASARQTLSALAKGFGAKQVTIEFPRTSPVLAKIDMSEQAEEKIDRAG